MKQAGQLALMPFPYTDLSKSKLRPVLLLKKVHEERDDCLVCMVSSQLHQQQLALDWQVSEDSREFAATGLKQASIFRLSRLAVLNGELLLGKLGRISDERLCILKKSLSDWIISE